MTDFEEEDYWLPPVVLERAIQLRREGKWTIQEIANKLDVPLENLIDDFQLRRKEIENMDE